MKNTGKKLIETNVYNHGFFVIDGQPSGPDFTVKFPFDVKAVADLQGLAEVQRQGTPLSEGAAARRSERLHAIDRVRRFRGRFRFPRGESQDGRGCTRGRRSAAVEDQFLVDPHDCLPGGLYQYEDRARKGIALADHLRFLRDAASGKGSPMKRTLSIAGLTGALAVCWLMAQPAGDPLLQGLREVEVASVADAMEQLYGQQSYMSHEMRPLAAAKFAGPAVTILMKKEEHKEGSAASQGMLDAIDNSPAGSVYVMVLENGADYAGMGGLMATAMKYRGFAGAIIDGGVRDTPQIRKLQFPVFSRGVVPSTTINHYRFAGVNVPVTCAGVKVNGGRAVARQAS
jgi:4-hydroxy-4-methyl-2-oxoglutarate aldolase